MKKRAGCRDNYILCTGSLKLSDHIKGSFIVISPYVLTVKNSGKENLILRKAILLNQFKSLPSLYKVESDTVK